MSPKLYWQSVQLSSLLAVGRVSVRVGVSVGIGVVSGCDSDGCGFESSPGSRDPHPGVLGALGRPAPNGGALAPSTAASSSVAAFGGDASDLEPKVDPPAPAGDLQAEIDAFTTVDACVEARTKVDPLLGDVLDAIGYDTFLRDACGLLAAAKARDAKRCAPIDASLLRERCEATVAEIAADPDACPWAIEGRPSEGRDPACLAIALRDDRLCMGVVEARARATCEAIAVHDGHEAHAAKVCGSLGGQAAAQCLRAATRWARVLGTTADARDARPPFSSAETLAYARMTGGTTAPPTSVDLHSDVQRGIVLVQSHDGWRFRGGPAIDDDVDLIGPAPHSGASFSFELLVPAAGGAPVVERAALRVPGHLPVAWSPSHGSTQVTIRKLESSRAGTVELSLDGDAKDAIGAGAANTTNSGAGTNATNGAWHVHADVRAFVRDIVHSGDAPRAGARDRGGRLGEY